MQCYLFADVRESEDIPFISALGQQKASYNVLFKKYTVHKM
jgi:methenyltetrahydromethanopterin cyclohydrolase